MITLKPMLSKGEPFVGPDGKVYLQPMQIYEDEDGVGVIRLGENVYFFAPSGEYLGPEARVKSVKSAEEYTAILEIDNRGNAPEESYYQPGTRGYLAETKDWPK